MSMTLVAATGNKHKLEEFRRILDPLGIRVISLEEAGADCDVEETGETFGENARIKAEYVWKQTGLPCVADDSGICVDALGGRPGVHSARYCGEDAPHTEKVRALVKELEGVPEEKRSCRFVAAIHCVLDRSHSITCEGVCEGKVGYEPRGCDGFGYDPIFVVEERDNRTFAELSGEEKDEISHRGRALRAFAGELGDYLKTTGKPGKE